MCTSGRKAIVSGGEIATGRGSEARHRSRDEDLRLIARVRAGDMKAFEQLYRAYHPRLTRFLLTIVRRPQIVEEVLSDTMLVVWERAAAFQGASKLSTWIFAIAYRKAMKAMRRQDEPQASPDLGDLISDDLGPEEETRQHQAALRLAEAMEELSPEHRTVLTLTYYRELGYRDIAAVMNCPIDTVKTRMFHARRHLKRRLAGDLADWL
jgi:RNA polymerase sigma factor (sigma-70 family)